MGSRLEGYCGKGRHFYGDPHYPGVNDDSQFANPRARGTITAHDWRDIGKSEGETVTVGIQQAWTSKQEQTLAKLRAEGMTWIDIASKMGGTRTATACRVHHERYLKDRSNGTEAEVVPQPEPYALSAPTTEAEAAASRLPDSTLAGTVVQSSEETMAAINEAVLLGDMSKGKAWELKLELHKKGVPVDVPENRFHEDWCDCAECTAERQEAIASRQAKAPGPIPTLAEIDNHLKAATCRLASDVSDCTYCKAPESEYHKPWCPVIVERRAEETAAPMGQRNPTAGRLCAECPDFGPCKERADGKCSVLDKPFEPKEKPAPSPYEVLCQATREAELVADKADSYREWVSKTQECFGDERAASLVGAAPRIGELLGRADNA